MRENIYARAPRALGRIVGPHILRRVSLIRENIYSYTPRVWSRTMIPRSSWITRLRIMFTMR